MGLGHSHAHQDQIDDSHAHGGGHAHGHHGRGDSRRALLVSLVLNGGFLGIEATVGWWTGSLALLSDAAHMLSDVGALALALGAAQLSRGARRPERTFGLRRAETLGAFTNGLALLGVCGFIAIEAVERLLEGAPPLQGGPVLVVGVIGLLINLGSAWALYRSGSGDLNVRGALIHMLADALGSLGAVVAAVLAIHGHPEGDIVVSLLVAALVLWSVWGLLRESGRVLLQLPPPGLDVRAVLEALRALPNVDDVHDLHVWTLDGHEPTVSAHLGVAPTVDPNQVRLAAVRLLERRFRAAHITLQVEQRAGARESTREGCGGCPPGFESEGAHGRELHAHG